MEAATARERMDRRFHHSPLRGRIDDSLDYRAATARERYLLLQRTQGFACLFGVWIEP
jgi:hypothetical protein